ncbi:biogenesis of lysosome-related organelles complex 1 subunit 4-like [Orbicella faveolata]|uniref:biogenesis of lysosome-related organelles complex 1 subunit 4-like n=1 Tax=Orbicella faveolata TaxID=48498 RepID=UPI0009E63F2A|nr:biogenesis of lysosome-related organelles complex 1 subunit 4-like [Orbicella faveolata]
MADGGEQALVENGKSEDEEELDLAKCAAEFAQYCQVDVRKESKSIEDIIEDMLVRLDEFSHLADTIRNDSSQSLMEIIPQLHARSQELPTLFRKIDQLEAFMSAVKKNVDEVEESVATAERELGSHTIHKVLSSIPGLRQMTQNPPKKDKNLSGWQAPAVFKTSDFFSSTLQATEKQSAEENTQEATKQSTESSADNQTDDNSSHTTDR